MWTLLPGDWKEKPVEWLIRRMQPIAANARKKLPADTGDLDRVKPAALPPNAQARLPVPRGGSGDILCLHDGYHRELNADRTRTLAALEHWLPRWRDLGLEFVTMDEAVR